MLLEVILCVLTTALSSELVGYFFHRAAHRPWSGALYRSHMQHHLETYPPSRLQTEKYIPSATSFLWWYIIPALPWAVAQFFFLPLYLWVASLITTGIIAYLNLYFHDAFHVTKHWMSEFRFFKGLKVMHDLHHRNMRKNFGIWCLIWDRVFKTLKRPAFSRS